jgi:hypothetical protein
MTNRNHSMTVAELRARLDELPDWAAVEVLQNDGSEEGFVEERDPLLTYAAGVLTIDAWG